MPRMLYGSIAADGTTVSGEGFTSTRQSQGLFKITFERNFSIPPVAQATIVGQAQATLSCDDIINVLPAVDHCLFYVTDLDGGMTATDDVGTNLPFNFIIIGD